MYYDPSIWRCALRAALSMAMAAFIILNTLRMNFAERRHDMGVVRMLGATSRQIAGLHLLEGLCLGLCGSLLGIPLGIWLGRGLGQVMGLVLDTEIVTPQIAPSAIAIALALGPVVACIAALAPALQARHVSPIEAVGDSELRQAERFPLWAIGMSLVAWCVATVVLLLIAHGLMPPDTAIPAGLLMLVAFIMLIPAVLGPIVLRFGVVSGGMDEC